MLSEQILAFPLIVDRTRICLIDLAVDISFALKNSGILNKNFNTFRHMLMYINQTCFQF